MIKQNNQSVNQFIRNNSIFKNPVEYFKEGGFYSSTRTENQEKLLSNIVDERFVSERFKSLYNRYKKHLYEEAEKFYPKELDNDNVSEREIIQSMYDNISSTQTTKSPATPQSTTVKAEITSSNFNSPVKPIDTTNEIKLKNMTFALLLKEEKINARITSGYRPGAITSNGSASHHATQDGAYDIVPTNNKTFDDLAILLITNPKIMKWFELHKWGIHSEVSKNQWNKYTTGAHFHIGPDKVAVAGLKKILERYNSGKKDVWDYK